MKRLSDREESDEKGGHCLKWIFIGLFMFTSGILLWSYLTLNAVLENPNPEWLSDSVQIVVPSILIVWITAGFWLALYGYFSPRKRPLEY